MSWESKDIIKLVFARGVHDSREAKWSYACHLPLRIVKTFDGRGRPAQDYMACLFHVVNDENCPPQATHGLIAGVLKDEDGNLLGPLKFICSECARGRPEFRCFIDLRNRDHDAICTSPSCLTALNTLLQMLVTISLAEASDIIEAQLWTQPGAEQDRFMNLIVSNNLSSIGYLPSPRKLQVTAGGPPYPSLRLMC